MEKPTRSYRLNPLVVNVFEDKCKRDDKPSAKVIEDLMLQYCQLDHCLSCGSVTKKKVGKR